MNKYETNYKKLLKIIPEIATMQVGEYLKLKSGSYMDLSIDILSENDNSMTFSIAHNSIQNGDIMSDPDMEIKLYKKMAMIEALTFQNSYMGVYNKVYITRDNKKLVNLKLKRSLNSFLSQWLTNLKNQGFNQ